MADVGGRAHEQENVVGVRLNQCWLKIERDEKFKGYIPTSIFVEFILSIFCCMLLIDINQSAVQLFLTLI